MTLFSAPVRFTHPIPGTSADPEASARVAEFSIWLPGSNRLLVLGAPQVKTVYYAKDGKKYVEEPTSDGVALFPRTKSALHGQPAADLVQVRDARDRALTPPVGWSTPDLSLTGSGAVYVTGEGWTGLQAVAPSLLGLATPVPTQAPTTHPSPTPPRSGMPSKGTGTPSQSPTGPSPAPISDPAPGSVPGTTGTPTDSGTTSSPAALSPTGLSGPVAW
jgi:hypothetical protein